MSDECADKTSEILNSPWQIGRQSQIGIAIVCILPDGQRYVVTRVVATGRTDIASQQIAKHIVTLHNSMLKTT